MLAAESLAKHGIEARVINMASTSPFDRDAIVAAAVQPGAIVTVEEHTIRGRLGGLVAETVAAECPVPIRFIGVSGVFAPTGSAAFDRFGMSVEGIHRAARDVIEHRERLTDRDSRDRPLHILVGLCLGRRAARPTTDPQPLSVGGLGPAMTPDGAQLASAACSEKAE